MAGCWCWLVGCVLMNVSPAYWAVRQFRTDLYDAFERRTDALLSAGPVPSPAHLSLVPAHRRGWGSLYAVLRKGRIDRELLLARVGGWAHWHTLCLKIRRYGY